MASVSPVSDGARSAAGLLARLDQLDIRLWLEGDDLRCAGPEQHLTPELLAQLKQQRAELIAMLRDDCAPLSFAQQRLWFLEQMPQEVGVYNIPMAVRISGYLDVNALNKALSDVIARHAILRTRYLLRDGEPVQQIVAAAPMDIAIIAIHSDNADAKLRQHLLQQAAKPFDLQHDAPLRATLLRIADNSAVLCLTLHHIACDGWSMDILLAELGAGYRAALLGQTAELPALTMQYAAFARWQRNRLQGELLQRQLDYWRTQLAQPLPVMELPTDRPRARVQTHDGAVVQFTVPADVVAQLRALGQRQSASLFMTLLAAFKLLLNRYSGQRDIVVGVPVANRQSKDAESLIGLFVNTLVLRTQLDSRRDFGALLDAVRKTTLDAMEHQDLPFEKLIEALQPERDLSRNPLFQVKFRLENAPPQRTSLPGIDFERLPQVLIRAKLDLSMDLYETADGITGGLEYNTALFDAATIERLSTHYVTLLQSIATQPQAAIADLDVLTPALRERQLLQWNNTARDYRRNVCFHQLFEEAAERHADATALIFDGPQPEQLSYAALNRRANQLAHWLRSVGAGPETIVGICIDRSPDMIVAMLAVLKAGAAYLPLDPNYPPERIAYMLRDADVPVLLAHSTIALPATRRRLDLDTQFPHDMATTNPPSQSLPQHLAYVIYTSGSTGMPKGVMIEHDGLVNLTEDKIRVCDVRAGDCVLQFFSFSFDASIPEIIMALASGAKLLLAPAATLLPGPALATLLQRHAVTHITMTPSALSGLPAADYPALRMVLVGGEAPAAELIEHWSRGRVFINAYGPTETTVNASMVPCGNGHPLTATLLPSTNKQLHILDDNLQLLPEGAIGELCIGGVGLARGYLNRPALTARQFVPDPFRTTTSSSERLYRTGDLAQWLPDGRIRLLGRVDHQVKIRGFRVELGDIEHIIAREDAVQSAVVIAIDDTHQGKKLAAFAVAATTTPPSPAQMREQLAAQLPHYMVPAGFHWLPQLPLTPNGKIDTQALIALDQTQVITEEVAPARNATEASVAELYADVLGRSGIGISTDFFAAGGHSLLATRLVARLLQLFDVEITVMDLFEAPTVAGLAQRIELKLKLARLRMSAASVAADDDEREEIAL